MRPFEALLITITVILLLFIQLTHEHFFVFRVMYERWPGALSFSPKMRFLEILLVLRLDLGQISFNLVNENAFATRQLALLATSIAFYDILPRACAEIKILSFLDEKVTNVFRLDFRFFSPFPFIPFLFFLLQ